jgi:aryl-alcohol dehydrogenase-like predicted oxidoreductase
MRQKRLGKDGPEISVVGFGAWEIGGMWGSNPPESEMIDAMLAGFDAGMTWVDTAEVYGRGYSEKVVGRALASRPDVLVFTKVAPKPAGSGFRPEDVVAAAHMSAKRLGRDVIDLFQLHWPDASVPLEETWGAMASLAADGLVRYIGVSNFNAEQIALCEKIRHVDSLQPQFSMLARDAQRDLIPLCERNGTGVIAYGPLAFGLLTGTITMETTFEDDDWRSGKMGMGNYEKLFAPAARAQHLAKIERLRPIADRLGASLAELALAWVFHQPGVTGAIAGSRRVAHTVENARAGDLVLSEKDLAEIADVLGPL